MKRHTYLKGLLVFIVLVGISQNIMAEDWINVSTTEEFVNAVQSSTDANGDYNANIRLTADIDLSSLTGDDYIFSKPFSGKITGESTNNSRLNYALKGQKATLFNFLHGATIEHLVFSNGQFSPRDASSGLLADESTGASINDVIFSGTYVNSASELIDYDRVGVVTGIATNCYFNYLLFVDCKLCIDGQELGMVAGEATKSYFTGCIVNLHCELWADGNSILGAAHNGYVGGICGYAAGCDFIKCYNFGIVSSDDDETGGIVGYAKMDESYNYCHIIDCQNGGLVYNCTKDGFGKASRESVANFCLKSAIISGVTDLLPMVFFTCKSDALDDFLDDSPSDFMDRLESYYSNACAWNTYHRLPDMQGETYREFLADVGQVRYYNEVSLGTKIIFGCVANSPIGLLATTAAFSLVYEGLSIYNSSVATAPDQVGGIAGYVVDNTQVLRCVNAGPINGADKYVGGIVGDLANSSIKDCYNRSFVNSGIDAYTGNYVGGIVGNCKNGTITGNLNVGPVTADSKKFGSTNIGNIEGYIDGDYTGSNNYYLNDTYVTNGTSSVGFTQEQLPSGEVALALNNALIADNDDPIWRQDLGVGKDFYPIIGADETKPIVTATTTDYSLVQNVSNEGEFYLAIANPKAQISIQNDIDLDNFYFNCSSKSYPFSGTIEGNGHTISNASYTFVSSDADKGTKAFFPYATGATFRNLNIENFHVYQKDENVLGEAFNTFALLVAVSKNCTYDNVRIRKSSVPLNEDIETGNPNKRQNVGGLIAISNNDIITDCTIEGDCQFEGFTGKSVMDANTGGFAALAYGTTFTRCHNAAGIDSDDDNDGGIVAYAENCSIINCLNSGPITGQKYVGGIAGRVKGTTITQCVNTATIYDDDNTKEDYRAGIVGCMETSGTISDCLNFGEVEYPNSFSGAIDGAHKDNVTYGSGNYYYCQYDGAHFSNMSDDLYSQMTSGAYACNKEGLYQSIDNDPFCTTLPVPIPAAGTVYSNVLCDASHTQSYSNHYHAEKTHTSQPNKYALCSACGFKVGPAVPSIEISDAQDLVDFSYAVNMGQNFSNSTVSLTNDIDMSEISDYMPIGKNATYSFKGTFNGNGHRIKNLTINRTNDMAGTGVFGCVSGVATITDLVVDKTCTISATDKGVAGIVGCLISSDGTTSTTSLTLKRCGNEASVISYSKNAAGLVGGVYNNNNSVLYIEDCYNQGPISGAQESAALVGYGCKNLNVSRCWNTGTVSGYDENHAMLRYDSNATTNFSDIYQCKGLQAESSAKLKTYEDFAYGTLCDLLNSANNNVKTWAQNLGTETAPRLETSVGIYHKRSMTTKWGTVVLPYTIESNDNVQLYKVESCDVSSTDGKLTLVPVDTVTYNTPCFFKKLNDAETSVSFSIRNWLFILTEDDPESIVATTNAEGWSIVGSYDKLSELTGVYYLANNKLWYAENPITVPSYRAYLTYTSQDSGVKAINIFVDEDGETTKIGEISADGKINFYNQTYNLNGQSVSPTTKGIIIRDGKKMLNK